jgi:hypothetical protein
MKKIYLSLLFSFLAFNSVFAAEDSKSVISSFRDVIEIEEIKISSPKAVNINLGNYPNGIFGVYNLKDQKFEPYDLIENNTKNLLLPTSIKTDKTIISPGNLFDNNFSNYVQLDLPQDESGSAEIFYSFPENITSDSLYMTLERYVTLPKTISLSVFEGEKEKIVFTKINPYSNVVNFPVTTGKLWKINIEYSQPIRINELQTRY